MTDAVLVRTPGSRRGGQDRWSPRVSQASLSNFLRISPIGELLLSLKRISPRWEGKPNFAGRTDGLRPSTFETLVAARVA